MIDEKPPYNLDLEKFILGTCLVNTDTYPQLTAIIANPEHFYDGLNRRIWGALGALYGQGKVIDLILIKEAVIASNDEIKALQEWGYLLELSDKYVSLPSNAIEYAYIIKELYMRRLVIDASKRAQHTMYDLDIDVFDVYDKLLSDLDHVQQNINRIKTVNFSDVVIERVTAYRRAQTEPTGITGLSSGIGTLDNYTGGWQAGDLIILAARPGMGKTAFALDIARRATRAGEPIAVFSLEMSRAQLTDRVITAETNIPFERLKRGNLSEHEWAVLDKTAQQLANYPLHIIDKGSMNIVEMCSSIRNIVLKEGIKLVVVDYLQLIASVERRGGNREQEISQMSRALKLLAKDLGIPIMALSQLSRACETRTGENGKRPILSDLRESGAIEQDADMVIFLYRESYYNEDIPENEKPITEVIFAKFRNGKPGKLELYFNGDVQRFSSAYINVNEETETPF